MNKEQEQVARFNQAIDTPRRDTPGLPSENVRRLRARLILEEALEVVAALGFGVLIKTRFSDVEICNLDAISFIDSFHPDMVKIVDGLCDLNYVSYGTADAIGVDLQPFFAEVHDSNMRKLEGPKDDHGKQLKPEGWVPPRIAEMLDIIKDKHMALQQSILEYFDE